MGKSKRSTHFLWPLCFAQYASYSKVKITHTQNEKKNAWMKNVSQSFSVWSRVVSWMEKVKREKKTRRHLHISDISYRAPFRWIRLDIVSVLNTNMYIWSIIHINFVFLFSLIQLFVEFFCLRVFFFLPLLLSRSCVFIHINLVRLFVFGRLFLFIIIIFRWWWQQCAGHFYAHLTFCLLLASSIHNNSLFSLCFLLPSVISVFKEIIRTQQKQSACIKWTREYVYQFIPETGDLITSFSHFLSGWKAAVLWWERKKATTKKEVCLCVMEHAIADTREKERQKTEKKKKKKKEVRSSLPIDPIRSDPSMSCTYYTFSIHFHSMWNCCVLMRFPNKVADRMCRPRV